MITGAAFTDDSARDAVRGINHSNVTVANIINALFAKKTFYAFMEDGHPADIPEDADQLEVYVGYAVQADSKANLWFVGGSK